MGIRCVECSWFKPGYGSNDRGICTAKGTFEYPLNYCHTGKKHLYLCDPTRNPNCTKESCYDGGRLLCEATTNPNCAFTDSKGEPIKDLYLEEEE